MEADDNSGDSGQLHQLQCSTDHFDCSNSPCFDYGVYNNYTHCQNILNIGNLLNVHFLMNVSKYMGMKWKER